MRDQDPAARIQREVAGWRVPVAVAPAWGAPRAPAGSRFAIAVCVAVVAVGSGTALALAAPGGSHQVPARILELITRTAEPEPVQTPIPAPVESTQPHAATPVLVPPPPAGPIRVIAEPVAPARSQPDRPAVRATPQPPTEQGDQADSEGGGRDAERPKHGGEPGRR